MDAQTIFILVIIAIPFLALLVYGITNRPKILTGPATVECHRVEHAKMGVMWSHSWNYLLVFRFPDGETLELHTTLSEYQTIKDGQHGMLSWDGNQLMDFIPDEE